MRFRQDESIKIREVSIKNLEILQKKNVLISQTELSDDGRFIVLVIITICQLRYKCNKKFGKTQGQNHIYVIAIDESEDDDCQIFYIFLLLFLSKKFISKQSS